MVKGLGHMEISSSTKTIFEIIANIFRPIFYVFSILNLSMYLVGRDTNIYFGQEDGSTKMVFFGWDYFQELKLDDDIHGNSCTESLFISLFVVS